MFEELVGIDERVEPSNVEKINRIFVETLPEYQILDMQIKDLEQYAISGNEEAVIDILREIVPTFESGTVLSRPLTANL
ncbi:MAG TPA: hypothetical protein DIT99_30050 [Candidatus Latescibacteria bacterium]|nr:hypothetical protein [Candidatus Latescibacterota bacterium]